VTVSQYRMKKHLEWENRICSCSKDGKIW
jgi:hypothetical protein